MTSLPAPTVPHVAMNKVGAVQPYTPTPHQQDTIVWLQTKKKALVAHEMGVGKTLCAIETCKTGRTLVICPASLIINWKKEILVQLPQANIGTSNNLDEEQEWHIVSYEQINKAYLFMETYDYVVADEAHYLKNPQSVRAGKFTNILDNVPKVILMTGTPSLNNAQEMRTLLAYLGHFQTPLEPKALYDYIVAHDLMMRTTKEVLKLKPPTFRQHEVQLRPHQELMELQRRVQEMYDRSGDLETMWLNYRPELTGCLMKIRQHLGIAKTADVIEQVEKLKAENLYVIVFAHHRKVLQAISKTFDAPMIIGGMSAKQKNEALEQFQEGKHNIIVCSIKAGGVGITLTKATHVIFAEFPWTPAEYDQAYSRSHRKGQEEKIYVTDMIALHPVDERHQQILKEKRFITDMIIDGDSTFTQSTMEKELIKSLLEL